MNDAFTALTIVITGDIKDRPPALLPAHLLPEGLAVVRAGLLAERNAVESLAVALHIECEGGRELHQGLISRVGHLVCNNMDSR